VGASAKEVAATMR